MAHSVRRHLRLSVEEYDEQIRRFIPGYEEMLGVAADAVAAIAPTLVVDLGAGTGSLSEAVLRRVERTTVQLLDVDPEMLEQARHRLGRWGQRAEFLLRSYDGPLPSCDACAASLSLHHIPTIEAKASLYSRVFAAVRPGGVFVNADANMPTSRSERECIYRYWADHMVACGIPEARAWQHFDEWADEDTYLPLETELTALARAGFEAECVWNDGPQGVVLARRPHA
ncbi:MAG: class I SAM-dependent methyltransferase [Acidobacteriota bacterium]|nr:class I SAM-dependent methyltransferase [Acidobacteriota bacterium]